MEPTLNNLRQALREVAAKLGLPAFWRWWIAELAPLAPAPRTALQRRRLRPILAFDGGTAVLWEPRVTDHTLTLVEVGRVELAGDAAAVANAGRALVGAFSRRLPLGADVKVLVALPRSDILRKQLTLPAAVEENLRETLTYDLDRLTPFRVDQLYFDAVVIDRDLVKKQIRVDWAAAMRTAVDAARRHAEAWGALVVGVTPEAPDPASSALKPPARWSKLNLLPEDARPEARAWRRPRILVPAALLAVLALVALVLPIWQKRDYVIALNQITEQASVQAVASDALRQQLDQATGDYNFALGKKYAYPSATQLLDDVTRLLPDDTWLTQFEVKTMTKGKEAHREILLRGESANAGRLVSALEDSKLVEQAAPRSPTTKIQPGPGEVFDLGALLKPLPAPEMVQLVSAAPTPPATAAGAAAASRPDGAAVAAPAHATPVAGAAKGAMPPGGPTGAPPPLAGPTGAAPPPGPTGAPPPPAGPTGAAPPPAGPTGAAPPPPRGTRVAPAPAGTAGSAPPPAGTAGSAPPPAGTNGAAPPPAGTNGGASPQPGADAGSVAPPAPVAPAPAPTEVSQ
jgi:general secretion pathway protein L